MQAVQDIGRLIIRMTNDFGDNDLAKLHRNRANCYLGLHKMTQVSLCYDVIYLCSIIILFIELAFLHFNCFL